MRGKGCGFSLFIELLGITPAYAGKSGKMVVTVAARWDHPRVCGEKQGTTEYKSDPLGSPPRMRGKVVQLCMATGLRGITPAYAGKSMVFAPSFL